MNTDNSPHPYDITPALRALRDGASLDAATLHTLADSVAIAMHDRRTAEYVLGDRVPTFDNFYATEPAETPSTEDTIDTFLHTFGKIDRRESEALTRMIFSPTPDYGAVLAAEEKASVPGVSELDDPALSEHDRLINSFISSSRPAGPQQPAPAQKTNSKDIPTQPVNLSETPVQTPQPAPEPESTSLTESLARVMIKNGNYSRALKIISELSLKNPEKSIYFADQIRFLRKLIINENNK